MYSVHVIFFPSGGRRGEVPRAGPPLCPHQVAAHGILDAQDLHLHRRHPRLHGGLQPPGHIRASGEDFPLSPERKLNPTEQVIKKPSTLSLIDGRQWRSPRGNSRTPAVQQGLRPDVQAHGRVSGAKCNIAEDLGAVLKVAQFVADLQGDAVVRLPHPLSQPQRQTLVLQPAHSREDPRR